MSPALDFVFYCKVFYHFMKIIIWYNYYIIIWIISEWFLRYIWVMIWIEVDLTTVSFSNIAKWPWSVTSSKISTPRMTRPLTWDVWPLLRTAGAGSGTTESSELKETETGYHSFCPLTRAVDWISQGLFPCVDNNNLPWRWGWDFTNCESLWKYGLLILTTISEPMAMATA